MVHAAMAATIGATKLVTDNLLINYATNSVLEDDQLFFFARIFGYFAEYYIARYSFTVIYGENIFTDNCAFTSWNETIMRVTTEDNYTSSSIMLRKWHLHLMAICRVCGITRTKWTLWGHIYSQLPFCPSIIGIYDIDDVCVFDSQNTWYMCHSTILRYICIYICIKSIHYSLWSLYMKISVNVFFSTAVQLHFLWAEQHWPPSLGACL